jgi:hypothetical protein
VFDRTPVIQTPKLGARIMRYELADYEWVAIKPMLPNKPRGVPRVDVRATAVREAKKPSAHPMNAVSERCLWQSWG